MVDGAVGGAHFSSDTAIGPRPEGRPPPHSFPPFSVPTHTPHTPLTSDVGPGSVTEEITGKGEGVVAGWWGWGGGGPIAQDGMCRGEISRGAHKKEADGANGFLARGALSCNYTLTRLTIFQPLNPKAAPRTPPAPPPLSKSRPIGAEGVGSGSACFVGFVSI